jgi:hypothetical protein
MQWSCFFRISGAGNKVYRAETYSASEIKYTARFGFGFYEVNKLEH